MAITATDYLALSSALRGNRVRCVRVDRAPSHPAKPVDDSYQANQSRSETADLVESYPPGQQFVMLHTAARMLAEWLPPPDGQWFDRHLEYLREVVQVAWLVAFGPRRPSDYRDVLTPPRQSWDLSRRSEAVKSASFVASLLGRAAIDLPRDRREQWE